MCAAIKYNRQPLAQEMPEAPSLGAWQAMLGKYACSVLVLLSGVCLVLATVRQTVQLHGPFCQQLFSYFCICLSRSVTRSTCSFLACNALIQSCSRFSKSNIFITLFSETLVLQTGKPNLVRS